MALKRFSVVIPTLNSPIIDRTLESLERQTFPRDDFEVIVVGMDKFGLIKTNDLIRFERSNAPLPPATARNRGAKDARGDILVFLDADCIAHPGWLASFDQQFHDPGTAVVGGGIDISSRSYWTLSDNLATFHDYLMTHAAGQRNQLPSLNLAIRRNVFLKVGGFDERYPRPAGEDSDLTFRLHLRGYSLIFNPEAIVAHVPPRENFKDLLSHAYYRGKYSITMDPRYAGKIGLPGALRTKAFILIAAPLIAIALTLRIFTSNWRSFQYIITLPALYASKFAWCIGASRFSLIK